MPCAGPGDKRIPRAAQVCRPYGEAGDFAYSVGAGVLTGPHVCGTFLVIGGRMRTSAPTHHAFGPNILVGPDDSAGRQSWVPRPPKVTLIRPSVRTGAPSPCKGEGLRAAQVCRPYGVTGGL